MERNWIKEIELVEFDDQFWVIVKGVKIIDNISKPSNFWNLKKKKKSWNH